LSTQDKLYPPVQGKTYSLFAAGGASERYYAEIKRLADVFLQRAPDEKRLLGLIQKVGKEPVLGGWKTRGRIVRPSDSSARRSSGLYPSIP
jgi:hypothetical protein